MYNIVSVSRKVLKLALIFLILLVSSSHSEDLKDEKTEVKLAYIKIGGKWGYIDPDGKMVINPQFNDASAFSKVGSRSSASP